MFEGRPPGISGVAIEIRVSKSIPTSSRQGCWLGYDYFTHFLKLKLFIINYKL
jgi:hypothetical protein